MMLDEVGALKAYILNGTPAAAAAAAAGVVVVDVGDGAGNNGISGSSSSYGATPATGAADGISPMDIVHEEQQQQATVLKEEEGEGQGGEEEEEEESEEKAATTGNGTTSTTINMDSNKSNSNENGNEGGVEWTDDMIRFLIESYDNVEQQLWDKNGERSKFKKKWDPIAQMMHDKFGRDFSKQQCLSKYWKVRRECLDFDVVADKISRGEPPWDEVVDKEALKPRYYSIWCDHVAGKSNHELQPCAALGGGGGGEGRGSVDELKSKKFKARKRRQERLKQKRNHKRDKKSSKEEISDCCEPGEDEEVDEEEAAAAADRHVVEGAERGLASSGDGRGDPVREIQAMLGTHLEASAKREELMLGLLRQNIAHMSSREAAIEERQQAMGVLVARLNATCEKLLEAVSSLTSSAAHHHHPQQQHQAAQQQHPF